MAAQLSTQQEGPTAYLTANLIERLVDGSIRIEGLQMDSDPAKAEEDRKHLAALLGAAGASAGAKTDSRKLSDLVADYFADGDRAKKWTSKTRQELESVYALMVEILGAEKPLADLSRKDFAYLKEVLGKLPSRRSNNPLYRDKSVLELAAMKLPEAHLLSNTSINKVLGWVSTLMGWGQVHGYVSANYSEGLASFAKHKRDDEHRQPYTDEEARTLKDAVLHGLHGSDKHPWQKWIPLLLMYQGFRVNEASQLALADFSEIDGIPVITVTDTDGKRVKTSAARRTIPVHPELIRLGLLDHIYALRARGGVVRVWPELSQTRDGYGQAVSKWAGRFRVKLGLKKDMHSLRHSVATRLREAEVPEDVVQEILGHTKGKSESFKRYAKSASAKRLLDALARLSYETKADTHLKLVAA